MRHRGFRLQKQNVNLFDYHFLTESDTLEALLVQKACKRLDESFVRNRCIDGTQDSVVLWRSLDSSSRICEVQPYRSLGSRSLCLQSRLQKPIHYLIISGRSQEHQDK